MTFETASRLFDVAMFILNMAGVCLIANVALSVALRARIPASEPLFGEVFGSPAWGDLARNPWLLRARFYWPWVSSPGAIILGDASTRSLFWGARLAGAGAVLCFAGFLATMVYVGARRAGMT
jgi:hypothetical protein